MILRPVAPPVEYGITKRLARAGNAAIALLRSLGTSAHVWLPGANGVNVASLPSNNYLLSDGSTGFSTVDGVDGLTLDGMGALGSERLTNGTFDSGITWWTDQTSTDGTPSWNAGSLRITRDTANTPTNMYQGVATVVGTTYKVSLNITSTCNTFVRASTTAGNAGDIAGTANVAQGTSSQVFHFVAVGTTTYISVWAYTGAIAATADFDNISVKEYTGTHLTQATTANKPLVRRGMLNELLNSATPATQSVTCIAAPYTLALYGTGNVVLSGTGAGTLTGTGATDLVVLNFTPTAGSVTFTKAGTVSSFGLFKGTWTAAQILAEGGIPTTTATAASNPTSGKYWWSFDGSNDSLLSGNLGITTACTIVIAGMVNSLADYQILLGEAANGIEFVIHPNGAIYFSNTVTVMATSAAGAIVAGVPFVVTARLSGGTAVVRKNGVQLAATASALTFSAVTGARVGARFGTSVFPVNGTLGWVVPLPVALSDAECLTVERLVSSQFPNGPVF